MKRIFAAALAMTLAAGSTRAFAAGQTEDDKHDAGVPRIEITMPAVTRPAALPALYVSFAGLQAYDGYVTVRGVRDGARETNPLVGGLAQQPLAFWSLKVLSTATSIYFAERLWREHHRTQAIVMMVVANGAMGAIAARNVSVRARAR